MRLNWQTHVMVMVVCIAATMTVHAGEFDHAHSAWTRVLKQHTTNSMVDYAAIKKEPKELDAYLAQLRAASRKEFEQWSKSQRLAFLCNAYNAWTIRLVVDHYPIKSIKDIGGPFSTPWKQPIVELFGSKWTLDQLEHELIRKEFREPRVHFALVCAATGCAPLRGEAYGADSLESQFSDQARVFLAQTNKNRVNESKEAVELSPIFKWHREDFPAQPPELLKSLQPFLPEAAMKRPSIEGYKVEFTDYDWTLNEIKRP